MIEWMNEWILDMVNIICNAYAQYSIKGFTIDLLYAYVCRNTQLSSFKTLEIYTNFIQPHEVCNS